jgi:hypothetical protein
MATHSTGLQGDVMKEQKQLFSEYLGNIETEAVFHNLENMNLHVKDSIDLIRSRWPHGFMVIANFTEHGIFAGLEVRRHEPK